jgi:ketosteroid isomerase-like protein
MVADEEGVVVEFRGRGTHTGPLANPAGDIRATGRKVDIPFCQVYRLKGGKIVSSRLYFDTATMMGQLGLLS